MKNCLMLCIFLIRLLILFLEGYNIFFFLSAGVAVQFTLSVSLSASSGVMVAAENTSFVSIFTHTEDFFWGELCPFDNVVHVGDSRSTASSLALNCSLGNILHDVTVLVSDSMSKIFQFPRFNHVSNSVFVFSCSNILLLLLFSIQLILESLSIAPRFCCVDYFLVFVSDSPPFTSVEHYRPY